MKYFSDLKSSLSPGWVDEELYVLQLIIVTQKGLADVCKKSKCLMFEQSEQCKICCCDVVFLRMLFIKTEQHCAVFCQFLDAGYATVLPKLCVSAV